MKKILIIIFFIIGVIIYILITKTSITFNNNQNLVINIEEKIIFSVASLEGGIVKDINNKYTYDFNKNIITLNKEDFIKNNSKRLDFNKRINLLENKYYILNGKLYFNNKNVYSCVEELCQFYLTNSHKYLIFIDKNQYDSGFIKKAYGLNVFKVLDLEKLEYKIFDEFNFGGKRINISSIEGYIN